MKTEEKIQIGLEKLMQLRQKNAGLGGSISLLRDAQQEHIDLQSEYEKVIADCQTYKAKYEKCLAVISRFDAGIIGMYDL